MSNNCTCSLRTRLVGDGCDVCNPSLALEYAHETIAELKGEIEELQRQNAMKTKVLKSIRGFIDNNCIHSDDGKYCPTCEMINDLDIAVDSTSAQSAAWLEASHIEWMKGLPSMAFVGENSLGRYIVSTEKGIDLEVGNQLYAIPTKKD